MKSIAERSRFWRNYRAEWGELLKLGFPVLLTQLGVIVVSFADTMMVGAYGVNELAASAFVNSVFLIPLVMLSGLANGITPMVGALFTKGDHHRIGRIFRAGMQINAIVSVVFMAVMGVLYFFLDRFGQPEELLPVIRPYYLTLLFTLLPMALFNAASQTCNGVTDTRSPMWFILIAITVNIIGNWLLIFGHCGLPEMGLTGAGIATVIARVVGLVGILWMIRRNKRYAASRKGMADRAPLGALRRQVWRTSFPVMIQTGIECSLWSVGAVVCGWFGKIQLAAFQVVNTVGQLGFMTYISFGVAVSIRVANFCGLKDDKGAGMAARAGVHLNMVLATLASVAIFLFARQLMHMFTPSEDVIAAAMLLVFPLVLYQYLDALQITFMNAIRGTSQVNWLLWIALISYVVVGIPCLLGFAEIFTVGSIGVYYSFNVALLVASILSGIIFKRIKIQ